MRQYPGRFVGFIAINPNYPEDLADELERGFAAGMAGIKIHERIHQYPVDGPNCRPVLEFADAHRLPVLVHVSSGPGAPSLRNVAGRYRNARFIIAHYNSGDEDGSIAAAARHDNVYLCTSFTQMAYGAIERLSGALGSRRLIFGSDMPLSDLGHRLGGILAPSCFQSNHGLSLSKTIHCPKKPPTISYTLNVQGNNFCVIILLKILQTIYKINIASVSQINTFT